MPLGCLWVGLGDFSLLAAQNQALDPGGNPGANLKSISHRCHPMRVAFVWDVTKETIHLPLGCSRVARVSGDFSLLAAQNQVLLLFFFITLVE